MFLSVHCLLFHKWREDEVVSSILVSSINPQILPLDSPKQLVLPFKAAMRKPPRSPSLQINGCMTIARHHTRIRCHLSHESMLNPVADYGVKGSAIFFAANNYLLASFTMAKTIKAIRPMPMIPPKIHIGHIMLPMPPIIPPPIVSIPMSAMMITPATIKSTVNAVLDMNYSPLFYFSSAAYCDGRLGGEPDFFEPGSAAF
jgi:hypothetical protein